VRRERVRERERQTDRRQESRMDLDKENGYIKI
jgi:hypothetical protein